VREINNLAHKYNAYVSTGGFIEHIVAHESPEIVKKCLGGYQALGFDVVELSTGFITLPADDLIALVKTVSAAGLKPKPELGIEFGAGGATGAAELAAEGTRDVRWVIAQARQCLDAGAERIMIESEGITESVTTWRTDAVAAIINELGLEATSPFQWESAPVRVTRSAMFAVPLMAMALAIWAAGRASALATPAAAA
jgi:phosphosulfolactate synthase (CoM biosynthesis protein A)